MVLLAGRSGPLGERSGAALALLYRAAPWAAAALVLVGLGALAMGLRGHSDAARRHGLFLLLTVILGPGLVVNVIFKDHWDRPRPRDIVELGGPLRYAPPLLLGGEGGKSFPCGHCSVGFLYGAGWWVWKRRRRAWAWASLAVGIVAGFALGLGRMAAGGHFLSDVVWSGLIALGIAHALHYYVLRIPAQETAASVARPVSARRRRLHKAALALGALGGAGVLLALFATAHGEPLTARFALAKLPRPPEVFEVIVGTADVHIVLVDEPRDSIGITGELHGFGLPTSVLDASWAFVAQPTPTVRYRITQQGWFTDLNCLAKLQVPVGDLRRVMVRVERGNVQVIDATRGRVAASGRLVLDVRTGAGRVQLP